MELKLRAQRTKLNTTVSVMPHNSFTVNFSGEKSPGFIKSAKKLVLVLVLRVL